MNAIAHLPKKTAPRRAAAACGALLLTLAAAQARAADPVADAASAPSPAASSSTPESKPRLDAQHCRMPQRPQVDTSLREPDITRLRFEVSAEGKVLAARVVHSSGYAALDQAALGAFLQCGILPAHEGDKTVPGTLFLEYIWKR